MKNREAVKKEWNQKGMAYAKAMNEIVAFGEAKGWSNYKGKKPKDERNHLAEDVLELLQEANDNDTIAAFRSDFPPSHDPFIDHFDTYGKTIGQLHSIAKDQIVFLTGASYEKRQAYMLYEDKTSRLDPSINAIGKSKQNNVFAIATNNTITTTQGWEGPLIRTFELKTIKDMGIIELIPFNDGHQVLVISTGGIFILSDTMEKMVHPEPGQFEDWDSRIDMANGALSHNNEFIVVGDQTSNHRVLNRQGNQIGTIGQQSEYTHYCLFSKNDGQLITNSSYFYSGITIGMDTNKLHGIAIPEYEESPLFTYIDKEMRVYRAVAAKDYYILGDTYGFIRAIDAHGKRIWCHFLGSTITGMVLSDDEQTLWVGCFSGILHKLQLGKGTRDTHTIGNTNHFEDFRLLLWKNRPVLKW